MVHERLVITMVLTETWGYVTWMDHQPEFGCLFVGNIHGEQSRDSL